MRRIAWRHIAAAAVLLGSGLGLTAQSETSPIESETSAELISASNFVQIGATSFYVTVFHVYDAKLWGPEQEFAWDKPFRLELVYARDISRDQLVSASLKEMARVHGGKAPDYEDFRAPLMACFRDVKKGDTIEGYSFNRDRAEFTYNGEKTCDLTATESSYKFFSIWLSDKSRSKKQSRRLRGLR